MIDRPGRVLLVGMPDSRGLLAAARSLGRAGWGVGVAATGPAGLAAASRYAWATYRVPDVDRGAAAFTGAVAEVISDRGYDLVFGGNEGEVLALSLARDDLEAIFPYASHERLVQALDKQLLGEAAQDAGFAMPRTLALDEALASNVPVVIKARRHAQPDKEGHPARIDTNLVAPERIERRVAEVVERGGEVLIQENVIGTLVAYSAVVDSSSEVVTDVQQEAARIYPPGAGASCRGATVAVDDEVAEKAGTLLRTLRWFGLAEIQFLRGPDGVLRVIDLNGRFYGSLALAVAAGADLPRAWADAAIGAKPARARARPGVRYHWLIGDLKRARLERRGGFLRDASASFLYATRARHSIWDPRDPLPAWKAVVASLR